MDAARFAIAVMRSASTARVSLLSASSKDNSLRNAKNAAYGIIDCVMNGDNSEAFLDDLKGLAAKHKKPAIADERIVTAPIASEGAEITQTQQAVALAPSSYSPSFPAVLSPVSNYVFYHVNLVCVLFFNLLLHDAKNMLVQPSYELCSLPFSQCEESHMSEIGSFLYACIVSNSSPQAAADEYIRQFLCLKELVEGCPAFRTALEFIAVVNLTKRSPLGANIRLFIGALLSIIDQATDVTMTIEYFKNGSFGFAKALATMLCLTMLIQLAFAWFQNRKMGCSVLLRELLLTFSGLAPGVHAYKVASGHEKQAGEALVARNLLMLTKCVELVFESVPGVLLQFYAYITLAKSSKLALVSIATSALTTAFSASVMFLDKDLDPESRAFNPLFYGVFPDDMAARATAFFFLFLFSVAHVLNRSLGMTLFWATFGGQAVFVYYGAELAVYIFIKLLRRDMVFWIPTEGFALTALLAIIERVANKVLIDFTAFVHLRYDENRNQQLFLFCNASLFF